MEGTSTEIKRGKTPQLKEKTCDIYSGLMLGIQIQVEAME
jgi:hypothetical protein